MTVAESAMEQSGERRRIKRVPVRGSIDGLRLYFGPARVRGGLFSRSRPRTSFAGRIVDLSLGGMFVATAADVPVGATIEATFLLSFAGNGGRRRIRVVGSVRHRFAPDPRQRVGGLGVEFTVVTTGDRKALKRFLLEGLAATSQRGLVDRVQNGGEPYPKLTHRADVVAILEKAVQSAAPLTFFSDEDDTRRAGRAVAVEADGIDIQPDEPPGEGDPAPSPGIRVVVFLNVSFGSYFFAAPLLAAWKGGPWRVALPDDLYFAEKRLTRRAAATSPEARVEIPLPLPGLPPLSAALIERSERGLSFELPPGERPFLPGTPIPRIVVRDGASVEEHLDCVIRHVSFTRAPGGAEGACRHGVEFDATRRASLSEERQATPAAAGLRDRLTAVWDRVRLAPRLLLARRGRAPRPGDEPPFEVVRFKNEAGQPLVGLVNRSFRDKRTVPVVLIPTAFSRRKESTIALAHLLVEHFSRHYQDIAVLRFDYANTVGESHIDPGNEAEGLEYLHYTTSGTLRDLQAALQFVRDNHLFSASRVVLVSASLNSVVARRVVAEDEAGLISMWVAPMGVADAQDAVKNCSGDIDYVGDFARGIRHGQANILGALVDMDRYAEDIVAARMAFMDDARAEMARIRIPVVWLLGDQDGWVNPERVRAMLEAGDADNRRIIRVDGGHVPTTSAQALAGFGVIVREIWRHLVQSTAEVRVAPPDMLRLEVARKAEWERTPRRVLQSHSDFWNDYLLGRKDGEIGFDVLEFAPEYQGFHEDQVRLADVRTGMTVADVGCGTGNFVARLLASGRLADVDTAVHIHSLDLVPQALDRARAKHDRLVSELGLAGRVFREYRPFDLELSPVAVFRRWLRGDFASLEPLRGQIPGLTDPILEEFAARYDEPLHRLLRGQFVGASGARGALAALSPAAGGVAMDLARLAAALRSRPLPEPPECHGSDQPPTWYPPDDCGLDPGLPSRLHHVDLGAAPDRIWLPFRSGAFDRVVSSLVVSYVHRRWELLRELFRITRPGGRVLVSSMRRDAESSLIYVNLIQRLKAAPAAELPPGYTREELLTAARAYANAASDLVRLEEEGLFRFFDGGELTRQMLDAGFEHVEVHESFGQPGRPGQAVIVTGVRPAAVSHEAFGLLDGVARGHHGS